MSSEQNSLLKIKKGSMILKVLTSSIMIISILLILYLQTITWGELNAETSIGSQVLEVEIDAKLESEFNEFSIDYAIITNRSGEINKTEDYKIFQTGLGDFQENLGEILDSWKDKDYKINSYHYTDQGAREYTNFTIHTHSNLIPWWPVGMEQSCTVEITADTYGSEIEKVQIKRVWFEIWYDWDEEKGDYTKKKVVWEKSPNDNINGLGGSKKYDAKFSIDEDFGKVGIVSRVELKILDSKGAENVQIAPFSSTSHPTTINIFTMEQNEFYSIILLVLAFPFTLISLILTVLAIPLVLLSHRLGTILILVALIVGILGYVFYFNGFNTLIDVLDSTFKLNGMSIDVPAGLELNGLVPLIYGVSMALLVTGFITAFINQLPKQPKQKKEKKGKKDKKEKRSARTFKPSEPSKPSELTKRSKTRKSKKHQQEIDPVETPSQTITFKPLSELDDSDVENNSDKRVENIGSDENTNTSHNRKIPSKDRGKGKVKGSV
jgi:hypothetical protein